jgi:ketosteroid isomerase-like protein
MPSPNIEVVQRGADAWARGDVDAMLREYHAEVEIVDPERAGPGPFRGHDAFRKWMEEWLESWDHYDVEIEALVEVGDHVVAFQHHVGRAKGSGIELDQQGALLLQVRDGRIVLHRPFTRRADALEGAGLADGKSWRTAIETILAGYEAWNRRDLDGLVKILEPDAEFVPIEQSIMQSFTGPEGMRTFFDASVEVWEEFLFIPVVFVPIGDAVLVELDVKGTGAGSGIVIEEHWAHVYTQRDGRLVRFQAFRSPEEALQALAYPDQP